MLLSNLLNKKVILASKSPRRQHLLKGLEIEFEIRTKDIEEVYPDEIKGKDVAIYLSQLKAKEMSGELTEDEVLITADTIVILGDDILEKPEDKAHAISMIERLNDNMHTVVTAVTLVHNDSFETAVDSK